MGHVPTHGPFCTKVRSHPAKCPTCKQPVHYFECSCGSKVFLEVGLGGGEHDCRAAAQVHTRADRTEELRTCPFCARRVKRARYLRHMANCGR